MSKVLIGICTYGILDFTKLTIKHMKKTIQHDVDYCLVVGKPGDYETIQWALGEGLHLIIHDKNYGFPKGINDIYDYAWKQNNYDYLIISGPDVIVYPNTVDLLIDKAENSDWEWISSSQFDSKTLVAMYPDTSKYFRGSSMDFVEYDAEPWTAHKDYDRPESLEPNVIKDVHNLCLYKKSVMDKIGYIDVGFFPAYYCLVPETLVLTSDLSWKPIGELNVGDEIVGVDEFPETPRVSRSYRKAIIEKKRELKADCIKITLSDGKELVCSKNHRWLIKRPVSETYFWRKAGELSVGERMCVPLSTWETETSFDAGWLSGIFDGEGTIHMGKGKHSLSFYQNKGLVLDRGKQILTSLNIPYNFGDKNNGVAEYVDIDQKPYVLELLGRLKPTRLLKSKVWDGLRICNKNKNVVRIVNIEPVGERDVVDIQVSTRAFLANGVVSHNSDNDYARRGVNAELKTCALGNSVYFHFWSRTIHQGSEGSTPAYFDNNRKFYIMKWNGDFAREKWTIPFNGNSFVLYNDVVLPGSLNISSRYNEPAIIEYWRQRGR